MKTQDEMIQDLQRMGIKVVMMPMAEMPSRDFLPMELREMVHSCRPSSNGSNDENE